MEGYIFRKTGSFGFYSRVFAVIEGDDLLFYDSLDVQTHLFKDFKGVMHLKGGKLKTMRDGLRRYCVKIDCCALKGTHGTKSEVLDFGDPKSCQSWVSALNKALTPTSDESEEEILKKHKATLQLPEEGTMTKAAITRNYKRVCLRHHPDKGGDSAIFNEMVSSYKWLLAYQEEQDRLSRTRAVDYDVILERGESGMGFSVTEDKMRKGIYITDVHDNINVIGMTAEAEGEIRIDDKLLGIDKDDCSQWPISRVRARLALSRVPKGSHITFLIERRVLKDEENVKEEVEHNTTPTPLSPESAPPMSPFPSRSFSPSSFYQGGSSPAARENPPAFAAHAAEQHTSEDPISPPNPPPSFFSSVPPKHTHSPHPFPTRERNESRNDSQRNDSESEQIRQIKKLQQELDDTNRRKNDEILRLQQELTSMRGEVSRIQGELKQAKKNTQSCRLKDSELGKILAQSRRIFLSMLGGDRADDTPRKGAARNTNKKGDASARKLQQNLEELSMLNTTAFKVLSFSPREVENLVEEQDTIAKLREKVEGIEKLLSSTLNIGVQGGGGKV